MMIVKDKGQICKKCGEFTKKFIVCEVCKKRICTDCAADDNFCMEHLIKVKKMSIVEDYYTEKYRGSALDEI